MMNDVTLVHLSLSALRPVPVGLLYIAAVLRRAGYLLDFQDLHGSHRIEDCADVVGIGYMSDALPRALKTAETLKRQHPGKTVILGGPGPSAVAREIVSSFPYIDVVVIGEGEETILEVMDCLARDDRSRLSKVDGICCRIDGQVVQTPARERIRDLDALPLPLYDCIPMEEYPLINVVSSRGCPYRCTFCDVSPMWQRKHFRRSVESVVNELILLKERYGKTEIEFTDETFVLNRDKVSTFCERLRRERIEVRWACTGRVDLVTEDLLAEMASSGCGALFYGLESGSDVVLEKIDKRFTVGEALAAIHMTRQYMHVAASFIWGFPFEEINELVETLLMTAYLAQIGVDARLNRLLPFARSPLYREYRDRLIPCDALMVTDPFLTATGGNGFDDMARQYPFVFPEHYWFPTRDLDAKRALVESFRRYGRVEEWPIMTGASHGS